VVLINSSRDAIIGLISSSFHTKFLLNFYLILHVTFNIDFIYSSPLSTH